MNFVIPIASSDDDQFPCNGNVVAAASTTNSSDTYDQIARNPALKLRLDLWKKEEEVVNQRIERKEQRLQNTKNEIYQLLGIYFVFQGVILTALAQATNLPKERLWIPFVLSILASLATILALIFKLEDCAELERHIASEKQLSRALFQASDTLKSMGSSYNHTDLQLLPHLSSTKPINRSTFWSNHMGAYGAFLLVILCIFSAIMASSCLIIHSRPGAKPVQAQGN